MPVSKATKERRIREKKCTLCENPAKPLDKDPTQLAKFCKEHLQFASRYRKLWSAEHPCERVWVRKCTVCRQTGHDRANCKDPRAEEFRKAIKNATN